MTTYHPTAVELYQHHVTRLDAAQRQCPALKKIIAQARRYTTSPQGGAGLIVTTESLKALSGFNRVGYQALLLSLPADFEPLLPALMDTKPSIINDVTLDVQTLLTSARWMLENRVKVLVDIEPLNRITSANSRQLPIAHEYLGLTSIPLIMCAGKSIGLGAVFQAGEHASRSVPGRGRITELADQALLGPGASVVTLEYLFGQFHTHLKAGVASQADDVLHIGPFAPAQQPLTTEPGVAPDDDLHIWPGLTQPRHQQPQHGRRMPGTINAAGSQQHQPAIGTEVTALEIGLQMTASKAPKIQLFSGTIWHRRYLPKILFCTSILCGLKGMRRFLLVKFPG